MDDDGRRLIIGVGNEFRRDDGIGPLVVAELHARQPSDPALSGVDLRVSDGEPAGLLNLWAGANLVVVVDAVRVDGEEPGCLHEFVLDDDIPAFGRPTAGTHNVGFGDTVALGRVLGRLPRRLVVLAVTGREFGLGTNPSPQVAAAVRPVTLRARELACRP